MGTFDAIVIPDGSGGVLDTIARSGPLEQGVFDNTGMWQPATGQTRVPVPGFGVDGNGVPYYDTKGASLGEEASLYVDGLAGASVIRDASIISLVAHAVGYGSGLASTATTPPVVTTGATLLVAALAWDGTAAISDSYGNTWTQGPQSITSMGVGLWYCRNPIVGAGHTFSGSGNHPHITVAAFSDVDGSQPIDISEFVNTSGTTTAQLGSAMPAVGRELIVTVDGGVTGNGNTFIDEGFAITDPGGGSFVSGAYWGCALAYKVQDSVVQSVNPTWTDYSIQGAVLASFRAVSEHVRGSLWIDSVN